MSSRYSKQHYEDVALVLSEKRVYYSHLYNDAQAIVAEQVVDRIVHSLADLFAADNPESVYCGYCGTTEDERSLCPEKRPLKVAHSFVYHKGFDREQFLAACGLEPVQPEHGRGCLEPCLLGNNCPCYQLSLVQ